MIESPAVRQSLARLRRAYDALTRLNVVQTLDEAEGAWSDFLSAGNGVYSKLEQGCKNNGSASAWFGRVKKTRKDDPLLSYMHHARNSDEHRIEDITQRMKAGDATITIREPYDPAKLEGLQLYIGKDNRGHVHVSSSNEEVVSTKKYDKPSLRLVRVEDRSRHFDPPDEHLGIPVADQSPLTVGELFVNYLTQLIAEAQSHGI